MDKIEDLYRNVRSRLDDLGYMQPVSVHSLELVNKLVDDLEEAKSKFVYYKKISEESIQTANELKFGVEPYRQSNAQLIHENNDLHKQLIKLREVEEENKRELKKQIRTLEKEKLHLEFICSEHFARIGDLEQEIVEKTIALSKAKGTTKSTKLSVTNNKRLLKLSERTSTNNFKTTNECTFQQTNDNLKEIINRLKEEQLEIKDTLESYKNKVTARDAEILRLSQLLEGGRPIMAVNKDCYCCTNQDSDYRLLAKTKILEDQLEECEERKHEAMRRAINLAKMNERIDHCPCGRFNDTGYAGNQYEGICSSNTTKQSQRLSKDIPTNGKGCCCSENSKKLSKLQEKLDYRQTQIDELEHSIKELQTQNKALAECNNELSLALDNITADKNKLNQELSQKKIIENDLMLEIEKLKRSNAAQKTQLAEMESKLTSNKEVLNKEKSNSVPKFPRRPNVVVRKEKQPSTKIMPTKHMVPPTKCSTFKKPSTKVRERSQPPAPKQGDLTGSSVSPRSPSPDHDVRRSSSPTWKELLLKERKQFESQIEEITKNHKEHCAKYHPACHNSSEASNEPQWLLLERVQAERDYYHKEFSRLRDQINKVPDQSSEFSSADSPNRKLENLLAERNFYRKEVSKLKEDLAKATVDKSEIDELQNKLITKEDELMDILKKLQELESRHLSQEKTNEIQDLQKSFFELQKNILQKDKRIEELEKNQLSQNVLDTNAEMWRKLNLKEEEILLMRDRIRDLELKRCDQRRVDDLKRKIDTKDDEILMLKKKLETAEQTYRDIEYKSYLQIREFSTKLDEKNKEVSKIYCRMQELERNQQPVSGQQGKLTRLEIERDNARGDVIRLQEERNALRDKLQAMHEERVMEHSRMESTITELECRSRRLEMERNDLINKESNMKAEVKLYRDQIQEYKDKVRNLGGDLSHERSTLNHVKLLKEQTDRALSTCQDILTQTEGELANTLQRLQDMEQANCCLERKVAEMKNSQAVLKSNLNQLDQEKDTLLLKVDEKTELNVALEREIQSRESRIAHLEDFVADLKKKLDLALDGSAHSDQNMRQALQEATRLRQEVDKLEHGRENALRENRRLQNDLAAVTSDCQIANRNLESTRREVEDLKLQLQGYVTEVRRVEEILQQKEAERTDMLEQFRSLTLEATVLESNNHSLESEAKSTKSCLRDTQEKMHVLEGKLLEKESLIQGYETQIGELTHHIAKMERQVTSLSEKKQRCEEDIAANRDLTGNLECQRQCLSQKLAHMQADNKRLESDISHLQAEVSELRDMLKQERKNSATLENVLAASRQESLQRNMDNHDLKSQVKCLQSKLEELQEKLEHGSNALRNCQLEASDYQAQVAELRREITNERFERARAEEDRVYSSTL
uniref:Centrosomal protein of 135 kDa n=3 Tax=Clastoptera arizonana TaxID=38151 RepID=A0A1B6D0U7_9HEMI